MADKIKIVWLCHFSNPDVREHLPLSGRMLENILRKIIKKPSGKEYIDFAAWVSVWIEEFEKINNVELHIISPHKGLKKDMYEFSMKGINYHFFKPQGYSILSMSFKKIHLLNNSKYKINRKYINGFIQNLQPDLVNLIGAENPYYSIGALDIKNIPVFVSLQTVYSDPDIEKELERTYSYYRKQIELKIFEKINYYGCAGLSYRDLVRECNKNAIFFKLLFPVKKPLFKPGEDKLYDFVYFGGINANKGAEDAIKAMAIIKKKKENVTLNMVGQCNSQYKNVLLNIINDLDLSDNIIFSDYFPLLSDLFKQLSKSRIAVLPVKTDLIPSTVRESFNLELPVVTNITTGTPFLNKDGVAVLLTEIGNIEMLAENMSKVLFDKNLQQSLIENATKLYEKEFDPKQIAEGLVKDYIAVINHYYNNIPIPKDRLFNEKEFPAYK